MVELSFGRYLSSPLYVTTTVLSPTVSPGTSTLITPSFIPMVLLNSLPIVIVTLPVASPVTVMLTTATSPKVMFSTFTAISAFALLTLKLSEAVAFS